ncbi:MAG: VIT1/CCC1 transporter family protein [Chloroflexi bacterium]|nr:VIT1/CCC1 transporter family protein [Chloroflexota bacterium]
MTESKMSPDLQNKLITMQRDEITGYHMYLKLAEITADARNSATLRKIAEQEQQHYQTWKHYTQRDVNPDKVKVRLYYAIARLFGLTFAIKLMEKGEAAAQVNYRSILQAIPELEPVLREEEQHETELIDMIDEESLKYIGSVVLGLNDALVELTGALAGLTFAFQDTQVIALAGFITGISASMSMAASEYLSTQAAGEGQNPVRSALYTGVAYVFTVVFLILPYLLANNYLVCLLWTMVHAILIIAVFNYYISVAKDLPFRRRFVQMASISLGVALLSFIMGNVVRLVFGIEI